MAKKPTPEQQRVLQQVREHKLSAAGKQRGASSQKPFEVDDKVRWLKADYAKAGTRSNLQKQESAWRDGVFTIAKVQRGAMQQMPRYSLLDPDAEVVVDDAGKRRWVNQDKLLLLRHGLALPPPTELMQDDAGLPGQAAMVDTTPARQDLVGEQVQIKWLKVARKCTGDLAL